MHLQGTCPPFRESICWIISPFKFWTTTIFLHAHLQVVYYKCVKFHKNPISRLGGVALTRYMDGRTGWFLYRYMYPPQILLAGGGIIIYFQTTDKLKVCWRQAWAQNTVKNKSYTLSFLCVLNTWQILFINYTCMLYALIWTGRKEIKLHWKKTRGSQEPVIAHLDQSCFQ